MSLRDVPGDNCTGADNRGPADAQSRQHHCTAAQQYSLAEADPPAQYGTWGNVAPRTNRTVVVDDCAVIDDDPSPHQRLWRYDGLRREEGAGTDPGMRRTDCLWVANSMQGHALSEQRLGQGTADTVVADRDVRTGLAEAFGECRMADLTAEQVGHCLYIIANLQHDRGVAEQPGIEHHAGVPAGAEQ